MKLPELVYICIMVSILIALSVPDIIKRKVPVYLLLGLIVPVLISITNRIAMGESMGSVIVNIMVGASPGFVLALLGRITGKVGLADGLILISIGMTEGFMGALVTMCLASLCLSLPSMTLLALKKVKRDTGLPFIPFLCIGYLLWKFVFLR